METICGGTIYRLAQQGVKTFSVNCTLGDIGTQEPDFTRPALAIDTTYQSRFGNYKRQERLMSQQAIDLIVEVVEIQGHCPVYRVGDRFQILDGYKLAADQPLCMHALQSLCPYYVPLSRGISPTELGRAGPDGATYVQCLDPYRYTGGGTVTFRLTKTDRHCNISN